MAVSFVASIALAQEVLSDGRITLADLLLDLGDTSLIDSCNTSAG